MREIKFEYVYSDGSEYFRKQFTLAEIENGDPIDEICDCPLLKDFKIVVKRQSIGRTGAGSVSIFEGDLIEAEIIEYNSLKTVGAITYSKDLSCWCNKNDGGMTPLYKLHNIKVIGSIYENPELLD